MKRTLGTILGIVFGLVVTHAALASCTSELANRAVAAELPLPPACRALGPLHLGMSYMDAVRIMGRPDASELFGHDEQALAYALPHESAGNAQAIRDGTGSEESDYLRIILRKGKVVALSVNAFASPSSARAYGVGDIDVGDSIVPLLRRVAATHSWNRSRDNVIFAPYGIEVAINPETLEVAGIDIFSNWQDAGGPEPIFDNGKVCFERAPCTREHGTSP